MCMRDYERMMRGNPDSHLRILTIPIRSRSKFRLHCKALPSFTQQLIPASSCQMRSQLSVTHMEKISMKA